MEGEGSVVGEVVASPSSVISAPKFSKEEGSRSRANIYLLDVPACSDLGGFAKIPKTKAVLRVFFHHILNDGPSLKTHIITNPVTLATADMSKHAAAMTVEKVKAVWRHHFGIRLVFGQEFDGGEVNPSNIMVNIDSNINLKILAVYDEWKNLERLSRRPDRQDLLCKKVNLFKNKLETPFNIIRKNGEAILSQAGIKDWQEELQYLRQQLSPRQVGCCSQFDQRQRKRDNRINNEKEKLEINNNNTEAEKVKKRLVEKEVREEILTSESGDGDDKDNSDTTFMFNGPRKKKAKLNIMEKIAMTADAKGISIRDRTALAASVVNALGVDLGDTNINVRSAWRSARKVRTAVAKKVKNELWYLYTGMGKD